MYLLICWKCLLKIELVPDSTVATIPHDLHRSRRAAINPYFSKASIRRLEPVITETFDYLSQRLDNFAKSGKIVPLNLVYKATTMDIITRYCFGESAHFLEQDDFNAPFFEGIVKLLDLAWWITHIAWFGPLLKSIPLSLQSILMPRLEPLFRMRRVSLRSYTSTYA